MKTAVLLSGGVDSSVALNLLKKEGHNITAFYLKIWLEDELSFLGECPWEEDLKFAGEVCRQAKVPLEVLPMQKEYFDKVVSYTINEVKNGRTPNPDIFCNSLIKFGAFFEKISDAYDYVATGHYPRKIEKNGRYYLKKAPDSIKDQTYFLSMLSQSQLSKSLFPIGHLKKSEVRELAEELNLPNKNRKDSQGICFLGKLKFSEFLDHYLGKKKGDLIEYETDKKIGDHDGFWFYTIGQRKNIRLPHGPWYVVSKDAENNKVYISKHYHEPDKNRDNFYATNLNWFAGKMPDQKNLKVKIRHGEHDHNAEVEKTSEDLVKVKLAQQDQGIAEGQFAVFFERDICLGGGVITDGS